MGICGPMVPSSAVSADATILIESGTCSSVSFLLRYCPFRSSPIPIPEIFCDICLRLFGSIFSPVCYQINALFSEPYLNHGCRNQLIINQYYSLHREVTTSRFFGNILDILKLNHISRILPGQKSAPSPAWFTYPNWLQSILVLPMVLSIFVWECP